MTMANVVVGWKVRNPCVGGRGCLPPPARQRPPRCYPPTRESGQPAEFFVGRRKYIQHTDKKENEIFFPSYIRNLVAKSYTV
jgi:hypothetical protein